MEQGQSLLQGQQVTFERPRPETDRLFMNIGGEEPLRQSLDTYVRAISSFSGNDVIEVGHPPCPDDAAETNRPGMPKLRLGCIASGKPIVKDDQIRMEFTARHQCIGVDTEFDQVRLWMIAVNMLAI